MPELPEVETIVTDLKPVLVGMRFVDLTGTHGHSIHGALGNVPFIKGHKVVEVSRRGKFINIFFENDYVMTVHLRMSGRLIFCPLNEDPLKFERTRIDFDAGSLRFCDMRKFGRVWISKAQSFELETGISRLGIEPLNGDLDLEKFKKIFEGKRGTVKKCLLDQSLIAGIGNIYADEGCFYAGIKPQARFEKLTEKKLKKLFEGVLKALNQGIRNRGTSISDFVDAYGKNGKNQEVLYVYGRGEKDCLKCGHKLVKDRVAGRGTVYCNSCQL